MLEIAYVESGPQYGPPVLLMHCFPYDVHAYVEVAPILAAVGYRVVVPYLRGFGPTRFLNADTPRSGEQAALLAESRCEAIFNVLGSRPHWQPHEVMLVRQLAGLATPWILQASIAMSADKPSIGPPTQLNVDFDANFLPLKPCRAMSWLI